MNKNIIGEKIAELFTNIDVTDSYLAGEFTGLINEIEKSFRTKFEYSDFRYIKEKLRHIEDHLIDLENFYTEKTPDGE